MLLGENVNIIFNVLFVIASHYLLQFLFCHLCGVYQASEALFSCYCWDFVVSGNTPEHLATADIIVNHHWASMKMALHVYKESLVVFSIVIIVVIVVNYCHCHYHDHLHHHLYY